jgi:hypothetical protein
LSAALESLRPPLSFFLLPLFPIHNQTFHKRGHGPQKSTRIEESYDSQQFSGRKGSIGKIWRLLRLREFPAKTKDSVPLRVPQAKNEMRPQ